MASYWNQTRLYITYINGLSLIFCLFFKFTDPADIVFIFSFQFSLFFNSAKYWIKSLAVFLDKTFLILFLSHNWCQSSR